MRGKRGAGKRSKASKGEDERKEGRSKWSRG